MDDLYLEPGVFISPGSIKLSSVYCHHSDSNVQLWTIDASSKYYQVERYGFVEDEFFELLLTPQVGYTLNFDQNYPGQGTQILLPLSSEKWTFWCSDIYARYTINLAFYRRSDSLSIET